MSKCRYYELDTSEIYHRQRFGNISNVCHFFNDWVVVVDNMVVMMANYY